MFDEMNEPGIEVDFDYDSLAKAGPIRTVPPEMLLREKKKNVHAFVVGTVDAGDPTNPAPTAVTYNPYMHPPDQPGSFVRASDKSPIAAAPRAHLALATTPDGKQRSTMAVHEDVMGKNEDIKKAGPPPIPKDALSAPPDHLRPTPWDEEVISSAPKPTSPFGGANWLNHPAYPLVKPEHAADLEQHAAINEFGHKMPRAKAEAEAYKTYKKQQHTQAAAHHLAGMKAAHAAGNNEAARNHGLMYNLHSQAIGHEPVGPAHPDVIAHLAGNSSKVYKFKPHHGDQLALSPPKIAPQPTASSEAPKAPGIVSSAPGPMLGKNEREALFVIWQASQALLAKAEEKDEKKRTKERCPQCGKVSPVGTSDSAKAHYNNCPQYMFHTPEVEKAEMSPSKPKGAAPCVCTAYHFPHRHKSGKCGAGK